VSSLPARPLTATAIRHNEVAPTPYTLRSPAQIAAFFEGLELIEPGLVPCPRWRPDPDDADGARDMDEYCAFGRK